MKLVKASENPKLHAEAYKIFCNCRSTNIWSYEMFTKSLLAPHSLIATNSDQTVMGFVIASCVIDELEIEDICVSRTFRKRGVAFALVDKLIVNAKSNTISRLLLEVAKNNIAAISLYEKLNFKQNGIRKNYYKLDDGGRVDAILMELSITY